MAGRDRRADMGRKFRRQPAPERQAVGRRIGFGRACQHGEGQPALPQGAGRECHDRGRQRRQRPRRRRGGAADGRDLLLGDDGHQRGDEIVLGREIAVDGAGGDAGAFRHRDDLHRAHPAFARQRPRRGDYGLMAGGKARDHPFRAAIGHGVSRLVPRNGCPSAPIPGVAAPACPVLRGPPRRKGQCWRASAASRILVSVVAGVIASGSTLR